MARALAIATPPLPIRPRLLIMVGVVVLSPYQIVLVRLDSSLTGNGVVRTGKAGMAHGFQPFMYVSCCWYAGLGLR
jgi:hypothetical protein